REGLRGIIAGIRRDEQHARAKERVFSPRGLDGRWDVKDQPAELFESRQYGFSQVVTSPPGKLVFVSGQVAWDKDFNLVGAGGLATQARRALGNLKHALLAAGASVADITMLRAYIVDFQPEYFDELSPVFQQFFDGVELPASTWLGVQALAGPGLLIEIEAQAVVAV
ncbi:MAG: Rid family hydrolase, partial [Gammaproteobacteria bacterium]